MSKAITRLPRHDQSVPRGTDGAIHDSDIFEECRKKKFDDASQWLFEDWMTTLTNGGGAKERFQYCVNPNSSDQFLYFQAIQGHSEDNAIDPALQDNVLLPKGFTEYIYHVGKANELNSIIRNGFIPGGIKASREEDKRYILHHSEPDGRRIWYGETPCDLTKPRIAPHKNTWKRLQNSVFRSNWMLAQEKYMQFFYQTRSHAVVLYNTQPAACIEKAVCMKTQDELYQNGSPDSERTTYRTKIELAIWSTSSTSPRRKIILGAIERFEKLRRKL